MYTPNRPSFIDLPSHSSSIFENAASMWIVNEEEPDSYISDRVKHLIDFTRGDLEATSNTHISGSGDLAGTITLSDGISESFRLADEKRPDTTPLFIAINKLAGRSGKGRFVVVLCGNSEQLIPVYLRPAEQVAFRNWEERQYCVAGPAPIDWFE